MKVEIVRCNRYRYFPPHTEGKRQGPRSPASVSCPADAISAEARVAYHQERIKKEPEARRRPW